MRGPETNPRAKRVPWQHRPVCVECGLKIRAPRPNDLKTCSRCKELLEIREFPHAVNRADHRGSYCRPCKQMIDTLQRRRSTRGTTQPISDFSPVGEATTTIIGTFVSQAPLSEYRQVDTGIEPVLAQYKTVEGRKPVFELTLTPVTRPTGTDRDHVAIAHAFKELVDAPLQVGDWLACVMQNGQLEKALRAGDHWPLADTSVDIDVAEDAPLGLAFGSYAPARAWSLGLVVAFVLDVEPAEGIQR
ncbi:MAG: hypothetical protein WB297_03650, partial [Actinomycetota bacterium]